jgi:hypothetical protein
VATLHPGSNKEARDYSKEWRQHQEELARCRAVVGRLDLRRSRGTASKLFRMM